MKVALFADIHGNYHALQAVLEDIQQEKADLTICAGDLVNPFPGSPRVLQQLQALAIPMVQGNHEGYILSYHSAAPDAPIKSNAQFMPVQYSAQLFTPNQVAEIAALPLSLIVPGPGGDDLFVCHASPSHSRRSFSEGIDEAMAADLSQVSQSTIVAGHIHKQWQQQWHNKLLVLTGSVGLALQGKVEAQYLLLSHHHGKWEVNHKAIPYNHLTALHDVLHSDYLANAGPAGWLLFDEMLTGQRRIVPFLVEFCAHARPVTPAEWQTQVKRYFQKLGRWDALLPYLASYCPEPDLLNIHQ